MDRYETLKKIDSGGYGEIFLAKDKQSDGEVVLKKLPFTDTGDLSIDAIREAYILTELKHENIIRYISYYLLLKSLILPGFPFRSKPEFSLLSRNL